jgi:Cytochrome c554 and c-prime
MFLPSLLLLLSLLLRSAIPPGRVRARGAGRPWPERNRSDFLFKYILLVEVLSAIPAFSQTNEAASVPKFLGAQSCGSSSCHGGAASNRNQVIIWSRQDFHSRSYATLATRRSEVMAEALKLGAPTASTRCTTCHAPFHEVAAAHRLPEADHRAGVSCESCHGPGEAWLRSHTRSDFSHADRVAAGMRDLENLYVRANTCVACHEHVDSDLLRVGHPELIFELDGQAVTQPKHWREAQPWHGAQAWLVGQAVALREMSWQLEKQTTPDEQGAARWHALVWLLKNAGSAGDFPSLSAIDPNPTSENLSKARQVADRLAQRAATVTWSEELTRKCLGNLAVTSEDFSDTTISGITHARRAERLVLGLDRLLAGLQGSKTNSAVEADLNELFKAVQSLPDFRPADFARQLTQFREQLKATKAN